MANLWLSDRRGCVQHELSLLHKTSEKNVYIEGIHDHDGRDRTQVKLRQL